MSIRGGLFDVVKITGVDPVVAAIFPAHDGYDINPVSGAGRIYAAGKHSPQATFATEVKFSGTLNFKLDATTKALFALAIPVAPTTPPPAKIYPIFSFDDGEYVYTCKATGFKASLQTNKEIPCTLDFICSGRAESAGLDGEDITPLDDPWISKGVVLTGFPTGKSVDTLDVAIANALKEIFGMTETTRGPSALVEDYQDVGVDIKFNEDHGVDNAADSLSSVATATIVMKTAKAGTTGGTFTLTNILPADGSKNSKPGDAIRFGLKYTADEISLA